MPQQVPTTVARPVGPARALITPTGVVVPIRSGTAGAWIVGTPCDNEVPLTAGRPIRDVTVLIDAGHGGEEPGATGPTGLEEADVNLDVAQRLESWLANRGISAALTRTADYRIAIVSRAEIASALDPDVFISIHHNAAPAGPTTDPGTEVFYQVDSVDSKRLGGLVYEELIAALTPFEAAWMGNPDRGATYRLNPRGTDLFGVLRRPEGVVAVLTEALFISSPVEEAMLRDPVVLDTEAAALGRAIERYLLTTDPGSGFVPGATFSDITGGGTAGCVDPPLV